MTTSLLDEVCHGYVPDEQLSTPQVGTFAAVRATWRVAYGLDKLLEQINDIAPNRNKASDGSIGDADHQNTTSDHNPDQFGIVRARDFTHDPNSGADMHQIAESLRLSRDPRIKYVIFNRRIFSATTQPWVWRPYSGDNPHDKHMHVSVVPTKVADDTSPWEVSVAVDLTPSAIAAVRLAVLGREFSVPGRTLAGTVEADVNLDLAQRDAIAELKNISVATLAAAHDDSETPAQIPPEAREDLAQRTVVGVLDGLGALPVDTTAELLVGLFGDRAPELIQRMQEEIAGGGTG